MQPPHAVQEGGIGYAKRLPIRMSKMPLEGGQIPKSEEMPEVQGTGRAISESVNIGECLLVME